MSPGVATMLLLVAPSVDVTLSGGVGTTTSGGITSATQEEPVPALSVSASPRAGLGLTWGATSLSLGYALRVSRRFEFSDRQQSVDRFLPLHTARLGLGHQMGNSWTVSAGSSFSIGDELFATLLTPTGGGGEGGVPGAGQSVAVVTVPVVRVDGNAVVRGPLSRDFGLSVSARPVYTRSFGEDAADTGVFIPESFAFGVDAQLSYQFLKHTDLLANVAVDTFSILSTPDDDDVTAGESRSVTARLGVGHQFSERTRGSARAGAILIIAEDPATGESVSRVQPAADVDFTVDLVRSRYFQLDGTASAGVSGFANFATGFETRVIGRLDVGARIHPTWTVDLGASFGTPLPRSGYDPDMERGLATVLTVDANIGYEIVRNLTMQVGVNYSSFGVAVQDPNFAFDNNNISGVIGLDYRFSQNY